MQDYMGVLKLVRTIAASQGLTIEYTQEDTCPRTDSKRIIIQQPDPLWSKHDWMVWMDSIYHETGHNMPELRDAFDYVISNRIDMQSFFGHCLNIIDDYRVDDVRCQQYAGMREACDYTMPVHIRDTTARDLKLLEGSEEDQKHRQAIIALKAFDITCRGVNSFAMRGQDAQLINKFEGLASEYYDKLCEGYIEKYISNETCEQEADLLRDIMVNVFNMDPEKEGDGTGPVPEKEGEGKAPSGGGEQSDDEGEEESKDESKDVSGGTVDYEEFLKHKHVDEGKAGEPVKVKYQDDMPNREYIPHTDISNKIINFFAGDTLPSSHDHPHASRGLVNSLMGRLNISSIVGQARRLLQAETRKRPHFNQKAGRLDPSKVYRVTQPYNSSAERIFKTKDVSKALDTAVTVLVDYSGSMAYSEKIGTAVAAAVALEQLFKTLRVSCEILGFTEHFDGGHNYTYLFKPFEGSITEDKLVENMVSASCLMSNNCDGDNILVAYNRILRQKNPRKVIVVLSDGSPCGGKGDIDGFTKTVISNIEKEGVVDIVGIGVQDKNVERLYKANRVVNNIEDLPAKLIETLEHIILEKK